MFFILKKTFFLFLIFAFIFIPFVKVSAQEPVSLYLFHSTTCPHCKEEIKFLEEIKEKYPNLQIKEFEVSESFKNRNIFEKVLEHYKLSGGVPTTIIGEKAIIGFDNPQGIGKQIETEIKNCSEKSCPSWVGSVVGDKIDSVSQSQTETKNEDKSSKTINFFGKQICLDNTKSVCGLGVLLGVADGVNPCMFSVLIFLLTYLLSIGSRQRALKAGIAFIVTTFIVYFLFMFGIIKVIDVLGIAKQARFVIIFFALFAGLIMVKDYFFYGKWISLGIPEKFKSKVEALIKKGTIFSAIVLALFSAIVELPCTSGLPLIYISVLSQKSLQPFWYLILYNIFFIIPLILIVLGVIFAWTKAEKLENWRMKYRGHMRLVAGIMLLVLAWLLWMNLI